MMNLYMYKLRRYLLRIFKSPEIKEPANNIDALLKSILDKDVDALCLKHPFLENSDVESDIRELRRYSKYLNKPRIKKKIRNKEGHYLSEQHPDQCFCLNNTTIEILYKEWNEKIPHCLNTVSDNNNEYYGSRGHLNIFGNGGGFRLYYLKESALYFGYKPWQNRIREIFWFIGVSVVLSYILGKIFDLLFYEISWSAQIDYFIELFYY